MIKITLISYSIALIITMITGSIVTEWPSAEAVGNTLGDWLETLLPIMVLEENVSSECFAPMLRDIASPESVATRKLGPLSKDPKNHFWNRAKTHALEFANATTSVYNTNKTVLDAPPTRTALNSVIPTPAEALGEDYAHSPLNAKNVLSDIQATFQTLTAPLNIPRIEQNQNEQNEQNQHNQNKQNSIDLTFAKAQEQTPNAIVETPIPTSETLGIRPLASLWPPSNNPLTAALVPQWNTQIATQIPYQQKPLPQNTQQTTQDPRPMGISNWIIPSNLSLPATLTTPWTPPPAYPIYPPWIGYGKPLFPSPDKQKSLIESIEKSAGESVIRAKNKIGRFVLGSGVAVGKLTQQGETAAQKAVGAFREGHRALTVAAEKDEPNSTGNNNIDQNPDKSPIGRNLADWKNHPNREILINQMPKVNRNQTFRHFGNRRKLRNLRASSIKGISMEKIPQHIALIPINGSNIRIETIPVTGLAELIIDILPMLPLLGVSITEDPVALLKMPIEKLCASKTNGRCSPATAQLLNLLNGCLTSDTVALNYYYTELYRRIKEFCPDSIRPQ